jgi:hypothetical protein
MHEVSKEEFIINQLSGEIGRLKALIAEKDFTILSLDQRIRELEKEVNDGKEEKQTGNA